MSTDAPTPPAHTPASASTAVVLPADLTACHALIQQLLEAQQQSVQTIARLENYLQQLLRRIYGRSAEKLGLPDADALTPALSRRERG